MASSPEIRSLETAYNNLIRKIWNLPRRCHTAILHHVASTLVYTNVGYNFLYAKRYWKSYSDSSFVLDIFVMPECTLN